MLEVSRARWGLQVWAATQCYQNRQFDFVLVKLRWLVLFCLHPDNITTKMYLIERGLQLNDYSLIAWSADYFFDWSFSLKNVKKYRKKSLFLRQQGDVFKLLVLFNQQGKPKEQILTSKKQRKQVFLCLKNCLEQLQMNFLLIFKL